MATALWADRLAENGILVYEIRPEIVATGLTSVVKDKYDRLILEERITPIRRWGQPEDVGKAVVAIAEDWLPYSTGDFNLVSVSEVEKIMGGDVSGRVSR